MAIFEGNSRSLAPSFQNIQEAYNQQGNLALKSADALDPITQVATRLDQEFTKQRDFEKKLAGEGKMLFTPDMAQQLSTELGVPADAYSKAIGRYFSPDEMTKLHDNVLNEVSQGQLAKTLDPKELATFRSTGEYGKKNLAEKVFNDKNQNPNQKQVPVVDKSSSTGYRWAILGPTGLTSTQFEAPAPSGSKNQDISPGQKAVDQKFATVYVDYVSAGGSSDVQKQVDQLKATRDELVKSNAGTGAIVGSLPVGVRDIVSPRSAAMQQQVEDVVQRNLRAVLGAQFTENEGTRLIARAYNPKQPVAENVKRLDRLIKQIQEAADSKKEAAQYFEANGTLKGFSGKIYQSANDFLAPEGKTKSASASSTSALTSASATPKSVSDEDAASFLKSNGKLVSPETIKKAKDYLSAQN